MTEAQWRVCESPMLMLEYLRGRTSERKLWLFGVGCCRRMWEEMCDNRSRRAVELVEQLADGQATRAEVDAAVEEADEAAGDLGDGPSSAAWALTGDDVHEAVLMVDQITTGWAAKCAERMGGSEDASELSENAAHIVLLHDIVGDPFQTPVLNPASLTCNEAVRGLASLIYEERMFEHLPLLGNALEKAGCTDEVILSHCRSGAEHTRGCWVVDAILGKS